MTADTVIASQDIRTGKRRTIYAQDLPELREKEKKIAKDMDDNILTDSAIKKMTLNTLFERYMATRELKEPTRVNYIRVWNNRVKDESATLKLSRCYPLTLKPTIQNCPKLDMLILLSSILTT